MARLALDAVTAAVYTALNVAAVTSLLGTAGISDDPAQGTTFPFVWIEVLGRNLGGLGTTELREIELRTHTFTNTQGMRTAQVIDGTVQDLLTDVKLTVSGYTHCASVFYDDTLPVPIAELNGTKVQELISTYRIVVEA